MEILTYEHDQREVHNFRESFVSFSLWVFGAWLVLSCWFRAFWRFILLSSELALFGDSRFCFSHLTNSGFREWVRNFLDLVGVFEYLPSHADAIFWWESDFSTFGLCAAHSREQRPLCSSLARYFRVCVIFAHCTLFTCVTWVPFIVHFTWYLVLSRRLREFNRPGWNGAVLRLGFCWAFWSHFSCLLLSYRTTLFSHFGVTGHYVFQHIYSF